MGPIDSVTLARHSISCAGASTPSILSLPLFRTYFRFFGSEPSGLLGCSAFGVEGLAEGVVGAGEPTVLLGVEV